MPKGIQNKGFQMDRPSYTYHPEDDSPRGHEGDDDEGDRPRYYHRQRNSRQKNRQGNDIRYQNRDPQNNTENYRNGRTNLASNNRDPYDRHRDDFDSRPTTEGGGGGGGGRTPYSHDKHLSRGTVDAGDKRLQQPASPSVDERHHNNRKSYSGDDYSERPHGREMERQNQRQKYEGGDSKYQDRRYYPHRDQQYYPGDMETQYNPDAKENQYYPRDNDTKYYPRDNDNRYYPNDMETQYYPNDKDTRYYPNDRDTRYYPQKDIQDYQSDKNTQYYPSNKDTQYYPTDNENQHYPPYNTLYYPHDTDTRYNSRMRSARNPYPGILQHQNREHGRGLNYRGYYRDRDSDRDDLRAHVDQDPYENQVYMEDRRQSNSPGWDFMKKMMPSQLEGAGRTLRFRGQTQFSDDQEHSQMAEPVDETHQPKTKAEVLDQLMKLREQPWPMQLRQEKKEELKSKLVTMGGKWYSVGPVVSVVESGTGKIKDLMDTLDPLHTLLKRIEGKHGASVAAVFNFIRDMIRLNIAIALLLLFGVVIPYSSLVEETDQALGWDVHGGNISNFTGDLCSALQIMSNSSLQECNNIYTNKVAADVESHSTDWLALVRDFLQGTGYLEWTLLFSGYYPVSLENSNFLIGLAYLLTVLVTYIISLVFVVRFVAKFLRNSTTTMAEDYGMTYSKIVFTGWDFTVQEAEASKIESMLFVSEVKAAFDDEEHTRRSLERTRNDNIKLYLKRLIINLIIMVLIGGSWAGIYFLVREAQKHTEGSAILEFIWEYAPTLTVAGLNLIFPMVFGFFVKLEQYKGRTELFLTLSRCVLVRLTSLGILVITKVGLIHNKERGCDPDDEFICWETHLGQQVYAVLILDAIIQIGMNLVVNVLRSSLKRINNPLCKTLGTIEFSVPGHVLDVVYIQAVCWIGLLYSPLIATACLLYFCLIFFLKLFTLSVTCVPSSRVFRASRSSAMFMTILALAFFMCLVPNAMALLYIEPSQACSPFRGLGYAWEVLTYYICNLSGSAYWIRSVLFTIDGTIVCVTVLVLMLLAAIYYFSLLGARGTMIKELEEKLKSANKDKNYLIEQMKQAQGVSAVG